MVQRGEDFQQIRTGIHSGKILFIKSSDKLAEIVWEVWGEKLNRNQLNYYVTSNRNE